jgi:hypothetical protein
MGMGTGTGTGTGTGSSGSDRNSSSSPRHSGIAFKIEHGEQRLALLNEIGVHADFAQDCVRCGVRQTRGHRGCRS